MNAVDFARIKLFLDCWGVGALRVNPRTMSVPVLQEHGDGCGPAPILALFYVRHIKPDSGSFLGPRSSRRPQERKQEQTEADTVHPRKESLPTVRTIGARPRGVFVQVAKRNDMLLVLGPRWDSRQTQQKGNRQHRHTQLHAKMHSSSYFWLVRIVYELHRAVTRSF